jgi:hypothetical protein
VRPFSPPSSDVTTATLPQTYRNIAYKFSLALPADYAITEAPSANPPALNAPVDIIEFGNTHGNVQLIIEPVTTSVATSTAQ